MTEIYSPYMAKYREQKQEARLNSVVKKTVATVLCAGALFSAVALYKNTTREEWIIPQRYWHVYDRLEELGVTKKERKMIASIAFAETNHRHFDKRGKVIIGEATDIGISQTTPINLVDIVDNVIAPHKRIKENERIHKIISEAKNPYLTEKEKSLYLKSPASKRKTILALKHRITTDPDANLYCLAANTLIGEAKVGMNPEVIDARHNAPVATEHALRFGPLWKFFLLDITKDHVKRFKKAFNSRIVGI